MTDTPTVWLAPTDLNPAPFNPPSRINEKDKDFVILLQSIQENGFKSHKQIYLGHGDIVGDGHRRLYIAKMLNMITVPCLRFNKPAEDIWEEENGTIKPITSKDTVYAMSHGLVKPPKKFAPKIETLEWIGGQDAIRFVSDNGISGNVATETMTLARYLGVEDDHESCFRILRWLVETDSQHAAVEARRDRGKTTLFFSAIEAGEPLKKIYVQKRSKPAHRQKRSHQAILPIPGIKEPA